MDEYVTKHVDVKRVVSPTDTLLLETSNNIVIDTDPDRILVGGMRLPDYIESQIFRVTNAPTTPSDLEGTSAKSADATVNFDAVYSNSGEFRTDETRCAGVDASGSYIDAVRAHAISLDGASDIRLNAKTVDNIYVKSQSMREVIYSMVNRARVRNSARYDIRAFEHTPVTYSATGRESAHLGTVHTNTLRTHKITTNHTLIDGRQPDLVIRSSAGVSMNTPNLYLNNELFREYIKQFMDERQFFTLTVNTSPGSIIPYDLSDFTVREHGSTFDYQVQLFMYQKGTPDSEVQSGVAAHEDESSVHVINTVQFPYGAGKVLYEGSFRNLTPGQYYNMYADFLNLRTMTLVPKVHVMDDVLTVTLKNFTIEIINESLIAFHIDKYQEELTELYGPTFVFNLLINDSNVDTYSLSNTELRVVPSVYDTPYSNYSNLIQTTKATGPLDKLIGVLVFDEANSNLVGGPRSNVKTTVGYINYSSNAADFPLDTISAPVYNYGSSHTFNVYTPLLKILTSTQTLGNNVYSNAYTYNVQSMNSNTNDMITKIDTHTHTHDEISTNFYKFSISGSKLSNNWQSYTTAPYSNLPKFDYLSFGVMLTVGGIDYIYVPGDNNDANKYEHIIKYRATFSNTDKDMQIYIDTTNSNIEQARTPSTTAGSVILTGNTNDITISLLYKSIYNNFSFYSNQKFGNMILKALSNADSNVAVTPVAGRTREFEINLHDSNIHFVDDRLTYEVSNFRIYTGAGFTSNDWSMVSNVASITADRQYNISDQTLTYRVPNTWTTNQIQVNIRDNLGRHFDYTSSNYTISNITGSIDNGTVTSANYHGTDARKFKFTPTISTISTGTYSGETGGTVRMSSYPATATFTQISTNSEGYITYPNETSDTTYTLTLSYTDPYGFSNNTTSIQKTITIPAIAASITNAEFDSKPRKFKYRTQITKISDGTTSYSNNGVWSNLSVDNGGSHVTLPSADNFDNSNGVFQASNNTTTNSYTISNQYTDRFGFYNTISGTVTLPSNYSNFSNPTIAWDTTNYSRTFQIIAPTEHDLLNTYNWYVANNSGTLCNQYIESGTYTNSNIKLNSTLITNLYLKCSNISLCNAMGFTGSRNASNLLLDDFIDSGTFATYSVAFTTTRTFGLTASEPATSNIDTVTNSNTPQSYAWSNSSTLLTSAATCELAADYLLSNGSNAQIKCAVTTRNIVGFDYEITTPLFAVAGTFPSFTGVHTLSFTDTTTPDFSVTVSSESGSSNTYTTANSNFVLTYQGSTDGATYSNVGGTDYISWKYIRMVGRLVSNRGFHNTSTSDLAIFNAANYIPENPSAPPTVKTLPGPGNIQVKTCSNITFSNILAAQIGRHGTPPRSGPTIKIKRSSTSGGSYANPVTLIVGSGNDVVVPNLSPGSTYYFKYSKTYTGNTWTKVDSTEYMSTSIYVTTLAIPIFTNQIWVSHWVESRYTRISLGRMTYNSNAVGESDYNSAYSVKLHISKTEAELFTGTQTNVALSNIYGSVYQTTDLGVLDSNYSIALSNEHLTKNINIKYSHIDTRTIWQELYVGLEIQYSNYYSNVKTSSLRIRTRSAPPPPAKFHRNITQFSANINCVSSNAQIDITRSSGTPLWYEYGTTADPIISPTNIYLVISSDSNTIKRQNNINFADGVAASNLLTIRGSMYGIEDITSSNSTSIDVPLTSTSVYGGALYIGLLSMYPTHNIPGTLTYNSSSNDRPDYRLEKTAFPHDYREGVLGNHATSIVMTLPSNPTADTLNITVQRSTTSFEQLLWRHGSVTYNHGNYQVYEHKWAIENGSVSNETLAALGTPTSGSNYQIASGVDNTISYYLKLYVRYDNTDDWKYVITSNLISIPKPSITLDDTKVSIFYNSMVFSVGTSASAITYNDSNYSPSWTRITFDYIWPLAASSSQTPFNTVTNSYTVSNLTHSRPYTFTITLTYLLGSISNTFSQSLTIAQPTVSLSNLSTLAAGLDSIIIPSGYYSFVNGNYGNPTAMKMSCYDGQRGSLVGSHEYTGSNVTQDKSFTIDNLESSTDYYFRFGVTYSLGGVFQIFGDPELGSLQTKSTKIPPTAPTYPLANVVRGITTLTFNVDRFTAESHGDYETAFTAGYYVFIDDKYAEGSTGNLVITGLNIDTSYTVQFYKKYNTLDFDNSAYVNSLNIRGLLNANLTINRFNVDMFLYLNLFPWSNVDSSSRDSGDIVQIIPMSCEIRSRSVANGVETLVSSLTQLEGRTTSFETTYIRKITYTINGVNFNDYVQRYIELGSSTGFFKASYKLQYSDGHTSEVFYRTINIPHTRRYDHYLNIATL